MSSRLSSAPPKAKVSLQRLVEAASAIETPRLVQRWAIAMAAVSSTLAIILALALVIVLPLKEYVPYFLVERNDASVTVSNQVGQRFAPSDANIIYFASKFVRDLLTIDEQMRFVLPATIEWTRGAATQQWRQFVGELDRPAERLAKDPSLRRQVTLEGSPQIIAGSAESRSGSIVFFLRETTTSSVSGQKTRRVRLALDYALVPPKDFRSIVANPIGFYVTNMRYEVIE
jgi:type IV secretory pathway component VirB8